MNFFRKVVLSGGDLELKELDSNQSTADISTAKLLTRGSCDSVLVFIPSIGAVSVIGVDANGQVKAKVLPLTVDQIDRVVDIFPIEADGQGQREVAILFTAESGKSNLSLFRFDQSSGSWAQEPTFDYVPTNPSETIDDTYLISVEDIDDDNREDFLLLPAEA